MISHRWTLALLLVVVPGHALAASAPNQLRGKSVTVAWSENRMQRVVGEAEFRSVTVQHQYQVYVSSAGRVFSRMTNTNRRGRSGSRDEVGGEGDNRWVPSFSGQSMTVLMGGRGGGARRVAVSFDAGFGSCSADVVRAKEVGAETMRATSIIIPGRQVEIKSVTTSSASCGVQAGNVFGNE
jgi:hypothetical protein